MSFAFGAIGGMPAITQGEVLRFATAATTRTILNMTLSFVAATSSFFSAHRLTFRAVITAWVLCGLEGLLL